MKLIPWIIVSTFVFFTGLIGFIGAASTCQAGAHSQRGDIPLTCISGRWQTDAAEMADINAREFEKREFVRAAQSRVLTEAEMQRLLDERERLVDFGVTPEQAKAEFYRVLRMQLYIRSMQEGR